MSESRRIAWDLIKGIDWPRALNAGTTLIRELRGDAELEQDVTRMRAAAVRAKSLIEQAGRVAVACGMPCKPPRLCGFCLEDAERKEKP